MKNPESYINSRKHKSWHQLVADILLQTRPGFGFTSKWHINDSLTHTVAIFSVSFKLIYFHTSPAFVRVEQVGWKWVGSPVSNVQIRILQHSGCLIAHNCWAPTTKKQKSSIFINTIDAGLEFVSQGHCNTTDGCCWEGICYCLLPACSPPAPDHPATQYSLYFVGGHFLKQMEHACNLISPRVSGASF